MIDWSRVRRLREMRRYGGTPAWFNEWPARAVAIRPGCREFLTAGERGLQLFDAERGTRGRIFDGYGSGSRREVVAFSPDGSLAFARREIPGQRSSIGIWDVASRALVRDLEGAGCLHAVSPDGRYAIARHGRADAALWDLQQGLLRHTLPLDAYQGPAAAAFLGARAAIVTLALLGKAIVWDLDSGAASGEIFLAEWAPYIAAPREPRFIAAAERWGTVSLYDTTGQRLATLGEPLPQDPYSRHGVHSLSVTPDGRRLLVTAGQELSVWDVDKRQRLFHLTLEWDVVGEISPDGAFVIAAAPSGRLWRIDLDEAGGPVVRPANHPEPMSYLAFDPQGTLYAADRSRRHAAAWRADGRTVEGVVAADAPTHLLNRPSPYMIARETRPWHARVQDLVNQPVGRWDSDGTWGTIVGDTACVAAYAEGFVVFWEHTAEDEFVSHDLSVGILPGSNALWHSVSGLAMHPDERRVAFGSNRPDAFLQLWDARAETPLAVLEGPCAAITAVAFSADGAYVAASSLDCSVRVWRVPLPHNEELHAAVLAAPDDDAPRLAYADWLAALGDPRAELIRLQVARARLAPVDPRAAELVAQENALIMAHGALWTGAFATPDVAFGRGFIEVVSWRQWELLARADDGLRDAVVRELSVSAALSDTPFDLTAVLAALLPRMRLRYLGLYGRYERGPGPARPEGVAALAASPFTKDLSRLRLTGDVGDAGLRALTASPHLTALLSLALPAAGIGPASVIDLAGSALAGRLGALELAQNALGDEAAAALARCQALHTLNLNACGLGPSAVSALAGGAFRLQCLELADNALGAEVAGVIAATPAFASLRRLNLARTTIGERGLAALLQSPHLSRDLQLLLDGELLGLKAEHGYDWTGHGPPLWSEWRGYPKVEILARFPLVKADGSP